MILDWLVRESWIIFAWWFVSSLMGLTVLPALVRLLPALPDRGYTLSRAGGWLMISFVYWFLGTTGLINNSVGSILLSWMIVLGVAWVVYFNIRECFNWREWWADNRKIVLITEVLFIVLLVGFAMFRAHQNRYVATEQPMDLAFMNGILQSENFPPNDPWLSGYAISYYYFGYLMAALNTLLIGVQRTIGYNMHLALLFALTGTLTFGVVVNLIRAHQRFYQPALKQIRIPVSFGLMGMFFLLMMSNFHMVFVEMPYRATAFDESYYRFWDTKGRETMPVGEPINLFDPAQSVSAHWWWFAHARVITERTPDIRLDVGDFYRGNILDEPVEIIGSQVTEVIDEFPAFSFILGDSHPHVMALPFVLLILGLGLNIVLSPKTPNLMQTVLYALCVGALIFLNTWDMPIYLVVIVGAEVVRRIAQHGRFDWVDFAYLVSFAVILVIVALLAYAPFWVGFNSQAGGILPNVIFPTRPQQMFLMFGGFGLLLSGYLLLETWRGIKGQRINWALGVGLALFVLLVLMLLNGVLVALGIREPHYGTLIHELTAGRLGWDTVNGIVFGRRIETLPTLIVLVVGLALVFARLFVHQPNADDDKPYHGTNGFVMLLVGCGLGLILIPEFIYLRDHFNSRMNTIFKFYYQVWVLFSISSAFGVYMIITSAERLKQPILRYGYAFIVLFVLIAGGLYFPAGVSTRMYAETGIFRNPDTVLTLDGGKTYTTEHDYQALMCLQELVGRDQVVVAEAKSQGSYNASYGRVGVLTGIPIVLGWPGHQSQWRGQTFFDTVGTRPQDLDTLFTATTLREVIPIIERYNIDYILYGTQELRDYGGVGEYKFMDYYEVVCEGQSDFGTARVYRVNPQIHPFILN